MRLANGHLVGNFAKWVHFGMKSFDGILLNSFNTELNTVFEKLLNEFPILSLARIHRYTLCEFICLCVRACAHVCVWMFTMLYDRLWSSSLLSISTWYNFSFPSYFRIHISQSCPSKTSICDVISAYYCIPLQYTIYEYNHCCIAISLPVAASFSFSFSVVIATSSPSSWK